MRSAMPSVTARRQGGDTSSLITNRPAADDAASDVSEETIEVTC